MFFIHFFNKKFNFCELFTYAIKKMSQWNKEIQRNFSLIYLILFDNCLCLFLLTVYKSHFLKYDDNFFSIICFIFSYTNYWKLIGVEQWSHNLFFNFFANCWRKLKQFDQNIINSLKYQRSVVNTTYTHIDMCSITSKIWTHTCRRAKWAKKIIMMGYL